MKKNILLILFISGALISNADIRLPNILSSNMVLQQQSKVKLWGWCSAAEKIYITSSWDNKTDSTYGSRDAKWVYTLSTPAAGGPYIITLRAGNTIVLENIMLGEVWLCSGQSNMEFGYNNGLPDIKEALNSCANVNIRFFYIPKTTSNYPQDDCEGRWVSCDSNTLKMFSAVGYFFGRKLNTDLNVPIGLINSNWGGTPAEVWTPKDTVLNDPALKDAAEKQVGVDAWPFWPLKPGLTYNAMIAPITNFNIAGTIWYQGESNVVAPDTYSKLFTTMIGNWRRIWEKDFPFYYVQIAPYSYNTNNTAALLREQQQIASNYPNTGMVVVSDLVDDVNNIHPINKHDVGLRLANWALADHYNHSGLTYKNPVYKNIEIFKDKAIISFNNVPSGIICKGKTVTEFFIAGADKIFYPATVKIEKDKLVVSAKQVLAPVAVRFSFNNTAIGNIFSTEGLPVTPFRTDNWEVDRSKLF